MTKPTCPQARRDALAAKITYHIMGEDNPSFQNVVDTIASFLPEAEAEAYQQGRQDERESLLNHPYGSVDYHQVLAAGQREGYQQGLREGYDRAVSVVETALQAPVVCHSDLLDMLRQRASTPEGT